MTELTQKEKDLWAMKSLNLSSWGYPTYPINRIKEYAEKIVEEEQDENIDDVMELLDDAGKGMAVFLMFLYEKDYITREQVKELVKGLIYNTCTYGDFHKYAEDLGIIVNPKIL